MNLLKRRLAPILPEGWKEIDEEATRVLKLNLAGRKLVDFCGPHGWGFAAVNTGRLQLLDTTPVKDVHVGLRDVRPLVEVRAPIRLRISELDSVARGGDTPDLDAVVQTAERVALFEDSAIFNGFKAGGIEGILPASPHKGIAISEVQEFPRALVSALDKLRTAGVSGPYALALGPKAYDDLFSASDDGYPVIKQVHRDLVEGPIVRATAVSGAVLMSIRGADYELSVGQDLAIGYAHSDRDEVELFLTESFTFRVLEPAAAVHIQYG